jgi:hypothetical protein
MRPAARRSATVTVSCKRPIVTLIISLHGYQHFRRIILNVDKWTYGQGVAQILEEILDVDVVFIELFLGLSGNETARRPGQAERNPEVYLGL